MARFSRATSQIAVPVLLVACVALTSCNLKHAGHRPDQTQSFESPLPPIGGADLDIQEISAKLKARQSLIKNLKATFTLIVGAGGPKQQFNVSLFSQPPSILRVRGSQTAGTVFDVLVNRQEVQAVIYPERKFYRGTLGDLRMNPSVLGGVSPEDITDCFMVEQTLSKRLKESPTAPVQPTLDHYVIEFASPSGVSERYYLRKTDLLADQIERVQGTQTLSKVRFWSYKFFQGGAMLPARFDVDVASGAQFTAIVEDASVNQPVQETAPKLDVPADFQRMAIK